MASPPFPSDQKNHKTPAQERAREKKRRRNEILFAAVAFFVVLILTTVQVNQFREGDRLYVLTFNVNFVLLLGILLVVIRNGAKLLLERRHKILGSKLRTRLVLAFFLLSLLPCSLMFLVTTRYVQLSMDFWFKDQVETSMETALDVAQIVYDKTGARLISQTDNVRLEIMERQLIWGGSGMNALLEKKRKEYRLALVGLVTPDKAEKNWHGDPAALESWTFAKQGINWGIIDKDTSFYTLVQGYPHDLVFAVLAVDGGKSGYLVFGEDMGAGFKSRLDRIVKGAGEYKDLRRIKRPLKLMIYSSLGVLTGLIILGAIWFGFRVAREIAAPVLAMARATEVIARGDFSIRLADTSGDELGRLTRSFNNMAEDLEESQKNLKDANLMLEAQNQRIARHSTYIETVLNNIAAGVISFDRQGVISTANQAACEILLVPYEQLMGQLLSDIFPDPLGSMPEAIHKLFKRSRPMRSQLSLEMTIDGEERRLLVNVVGFATEDVFRGAVAVFEDISESQRIQRVVAWREVARRIAHEIKNPLTPIKLSAQRLARKFGSAVNDPAFVQSTELIVKQVEYLQGMVSEFSAFAKLPEVHPVPGQIAPLLDSLTALFRNSHSKIQWQLALDSDLPPLPMDKEALHRAFMNIYTNAAEALEESCASDPFVYIHGYYLPSTRMVRVDVEDNGSGLSEEERAHLFEPYVTHKKGGTGLGLTIARSIIADHRGYVRALSRPGGGTVISVELPLS